MYCVKNYEKNSLHNLTVVILICLTTRTLECIHVITARHLITSPTANSFTHFTEMTTSFQKRFSTKTNGETCDIRAPYDY